MPQVLQGQTRVSEVLFWEQVVLQLQGSAHKAKEITRMSSRTTILAKVNWPIIYFIQQTLRKQAAKLTSIDTISTTAQSVSIILKTEACPTVYPAWKGAITRRTQWRKNKNAALSYMQISLNWTLLRMPPRWHSPFKPQALSDLNWIIDHLAPLNRNYFGPRPIDITIECDASSVRWGALSHGEVAQGRWSKLDISNHINYLEFLNSVLCLTSICGLNA